MFQKNSGLDENYAILKGEVDIYYITFFPPTEINFMIIHL
jgi:hypothetical protein